MKKIKSKHPRIGFILDILPAIVICVLAIIIAIGAYGLKIGFFFWIGSKFF